MAQNFPQSCQNWFLRVQTTILMKRKHFWKLIFFSKFEQIFSRLLAKNILRIWRNCFLSVQTNNMMYNQQLLWKVLLIFSDFGQNFFWNSEFFFLQKFENCFLRTDTNTSIKKNLFWKVLFKVFRNQIETFSDFRQKIHGEIVRSVFYVFKNMLKKQTFSILFSFRCAIGLWAKLFWHVAQKFPQSCQNWFLRVQTTILMKKKTFLKIDFFFEIWANFFPTFGKKYFANLAELLSKRSDEQYDVQSTTSLKSSSYLFGFWPKLFLKFRILFFAKVWKLFSKNWYEHFNPKNLLWKVLFKVFRNQIEIFSDFRQKIHGEIVRSVFYVFKNKLKKQTFSIFFSFCCVI